MRKCKNCGVEGRIVITETDTPQLNYYTLWRLDYCDDCCRKIINGEIKLRK